MTLSFSHLGICVSDLDRSLRFYCEGLGFEPTASHRVGEEFAALMELEGVELMCDNFLDPALEAWIARQQTRSYS